VSKAFTKEDDDAGTSVVSAVSFVVPTGPFHITARGAKQVEAMEDPRLVDALARAEIVPSVDDPKRASIGVTVHVLTEEGEERFYRLVTSEERGLTGEGCSLQSPLGRALLGAEVGDTRTAHTPHGREELEVVALVGDAALRKKKRKKEPEMGRDPLR
jgi:hypothetical protein